MKGVTVIDLLSGCGGLSYGLEEVGFDIRLGTDFWKDSLVTFAHNHKGAKTLCGDIQKISSEDIVRASGVSRPTLIVGGPPCQGFSLSGPRKFYDRRNKLYLEFLRVVRDLKPKGFIIENVPGLAALFGGQVKERIIYEFSQLGYKVNAKILNASDYGVPQNRRRIVFVGLKNAMFEFPPTTHHDLAEDALPLPHMPKVTVRDATGDLPVLENGAMGAEVMPYASKPLGEYQKLMRKNSKTLKNHVATKHSEQTAKIISLVPEGKDYRSLPIHLRNSRNFHVAWTRLHRGKPSPTIDTGHRHHFHPTANRVPTVRESARIQSFPDDFVFIGTKTSQYKQVGNAVPPLLASAIGKQLLRYL
mgnify:CR=1 FL=1